jgi:hypothetical protein
MKAVSPDKAKKQILAGDAPADLEVRGHLDLSGLAVTALPPGLTVDSLDLSGCILLRALPADLRVQRLNLSRCTSLTALPEGLTCYELEMQRTALATLPADLHVEYRLDLTGNPSLATLPPNLKVGSLILRDCTALTALPEGLAVYFLDITGCTALAGWPATAGAPIGRLIARNCTALTNLPAWMANLWQADLRGCLNLTTLPEGVHASAWIDLADTALTALPQSLHDTQLRWRGAPIDERILFHPETIQAQEVLNESNSEKRRALLDRMGYEKFLAEAHAEVLDRDTAPGGERQLLRVPLPGDEPLVCVAVRCPSTGRQYMLRVPPTTRTCRQAVAWTAGFEKADDYRPVAET